MVSYAENREVFCSEKCGDDYFKSLADGIIISEMENEKC